MAHSCFKSFILISSIFFHFSVAKAQAPSDFEVFEGSYSKLKDSAEKIAAIDSAVQEHFKKRKFKADDIIRMASMREAECRVSAERCLQIEAWAPQTCTQYGIAGRVPESLWRGLVPALKTEAGIDLFLKDLEKCSQVKNGFMLSLGVQAVSASFAIGNKVQDQSIAWLKKASANPTYTVQDRLGAVFDANAILKTSGSEHLFGKSVLINGVLQSLTMNDIKLLLIHGEDGKRNLASLASVANQNFITSGNYSVLIKFLEDFPLVWGFLSDPMERLWVVENHCVEWIQTGQSQKCENMLAQQVKVSGNSPEVQVRLRVIRARNAYLKGETDRAIQLTKENLQVAKKIGDREFQNWSYFGLSQYYNAETHKADVMENLELFKSGVVTMDVGWMKVLPLTRLVSMHLDLGNWDQCLKFVDESRAELGKYVTGQISEHAWITFFEVLCRSGKKDLVGSAKAFTHLESLVRLMPGLAFQKSLAQAAMAASEKKDHKTPLKVVQSKIGPKHPELVRTERVIARLVR